MVQQIALDRKAYDALADSADTRLWLMDKTQIIDILTNAIERYIFENQVIRQITDRERSELTSKKDLKEESSRLYNAQIELLEGVVETRTLMTDTLKSMRHSVILWKRYSSEDVIRMNDLSDTLITQLRDLADVARLLEKYDKPFYNNRKFQ
jgi:hypothetical protein